MARLSQQYFAVEVQTLGHNDVLFTSALEAYAKMPLPVRGNPWDRNTCPGSEML